MREIDDLLKKRQELVAKVEEFHLPGQHDQKSHGGGGLGGVGNSTDKELRDAAKNLESEKILGGGRSVAKVSIGKVKGGGQVVKKTGLSKLHVDKEFLTSKLGLAIGAPVPNVARLGNDGVIMERAPGSPQGKWGQTPFRRILQPLRRSEIQRSVNAVGAKELGILDYISNQTDRRAANFLLDRRGKTDRVFGIDHTSSFWPQGTLQAKKPLSPFAQKYVRGKTFSREDSNRLRKQVRGVRKYFASAGRLDWYDQVQRRIDSMERGYDLGTDYAGVSANSESAETFVLLTDGRVNFYTLDFDGNPAEEIGFFRVVGGKIVQAGGDLVTELLTHYDNGSDALEDYADWSNGWIISSLVE